MTEVAVVVGVQDTTIHGVGAGTLQLQPHIPFLAMRPLLILLLHERQIRVVSQLY